MPKINTIFAVTININGNINKFNTLQPAQFHLWWCQVCGHGGLGIIFRDYLSFLFVASAGMPYENSVITGGKLIKGHEGYFQWLKNITKNNLFDRDFLIRRFQDKISIEKQEF